MHFEGVGWGRVLLRNGMLPTTCYTNPVKFGMIIFPVNTSLAWITHCSEDAQIISKK